MKTPRAWSVIKRKWGVILLPGWTREFHQPTAWRWVRKSIPS